MSQGDQGQRDGEAEAGVQVPAPAGSGFGFGFASPAVCVCVGLPAWPPHQTFVLHPLAFHFTPRARELLLPRSIPFVAFLRW